MARESETSESGSGSSHSQSPSGASATPSSSPASYADKSIQKIMLIAGGVFVALVTLCVAAGLDPLGLFAPIAPTPTVVVEPPSPPPAESWWQVYFTDPARVYDPQVLAGSIPEKLIAHIDGAQETIHIASFAFDLEPVADALVAARERGVEVQWVTDDEYGIAEDEFQGRDLFPRLERAGIEVKDDRRGGLMHNKFWIFDRQRVWTGSTNITMNGNFRNNNNVLLLDSPAVAAIYEREFAEMWGGQFGPGSPSTVSEQALTIEGTPLRVLFAPEDRVMGHLLPLVEGAQESVRFMAFSFTHDALGNAMLARARAGVDVQGIFEMRSGDTEYSELSKLYCAQVPVRLDGNPANFHHKVLVIDGETVVTGSFNFSENADGSNDENVVVIANREIAARYLQEFDRRWAEAAPPIEAAVTCD